MKRAAVVAILGTLAVGCGSTSHGGTSGTAPASTPGRSSSFPAAAAQQAAEAALLKITDFPAGWSTSKSSSSSADDKKMSRRLASCLKVPADLLSDSSPESAHADTQNFDSAGGSETVSEGVTVSTLARVKQLFSALRQGGSTDCLSQVFNDFVKSEVAKSNDASIKDASVGPVQVGQLSLSSYGDESVAMRTTIPVESHGFSIDVYIDLVFVRHANAAALVSFEAEQNPLPVAEIEKYTKLATGHLESVQLPPA